MNTEQKKALAHELTMLYLHNNKDIIRKSTSNIGDIVKDTAKIYKDFLDNINSNQDFDSF